MSSSDVLPEPLYMQASRTSVEDFTDFLALLASNLRHRSGRPWWIVLDNHPAHRSRRVLDALQPFQVAFQPALSSPFNPVETLWSQLKRAFFHAIYRRERSFSSQIQFKQFLADVYANEHFTVDSIMRVNQPYIDFHLSLAESSDSASSFSD